MSEILKIYGKVQATEGPAVDDAGNYIQDTDVIRVRELADSLVKADSRITDYIRENPNYTQDSYRIQDLKAATAIPVAVVDERSNIQKSDVLTIDKSNSKQVVSIDGQLITKKSYSEDLISEVSSTCQFKASSTGVTFYFDTESNSLKPNLLRITKKAESKALDIMLDLTNISSYDYLPKIGYKNSIGSCWTFALPYRSLEVASREEFEQQYSINTSEESIANAEIYNIKFTEDIASGTIENIRSQMYSEIKNSIPDYGSLQYIYNYSMDNLSGIEEYITDPPNSQIVTIKQDLFKITGSAITFKLQSGIRGYSNYNIKGILISNIVFIHQFKDNYHADFIGRTLSPTIFIPFSEFFNSSSFTKSDTLAKFTLNKAILFIDNKDQYLAQNLKITLQINAAEDNPQEQLSLIVEVPDTLSDWLNGKLRYSWGRLEYTLKFVY